MLQAGAYNFSISLRLSPEIRGGKFRVKYHVAVNGENISSPQGSFVDLQWGDHPDMINLGKTVDLPQGSATVSLGIEGVWNAEGDGLERSPDATGVAVDSSMLISLKRI